MDSADGVKLIRLSCLSSLARVWRMNFKRAGLAARIGWIERLLQDSTASGKDLNNINRSGNREEGKYDQEKLVINQCRGGRHW